MFCVGIGVVISTPMPNIYISTKPYNFKMFCVGVGVVIPTPMPHIDMSTKPDNYIMFCVGCWCCNFNTNATHSKLVYMHMLVMLVKVKYLKPFLHSSVFNSTR